MPEALQGVSVIITGGTRGIGRGMADAFVADGADVVITGRDAALGEQVAAGFDQRGPGRCRFFRGDVADSGMADEMASFTLEAYGKIDVVCANAGIYEAKAIQLLTEEDLDQVFGTNVKGTFFAVQSCLPALEKSGRGRIILHRQSRVPSLDSRALLIMVPARPLNWVSCGQPPSNWLERGSPSTRFFRAPS